MTPLRSTNGSTHCGRPRAGLDCRANRQRPDHAAHKRVPSWFRPSRTQRNPKTSFDRYGRRPHALAARGIPFDREVLTDLNTLLDNVAAAAPDTLDDVNDIPTRWDGAPTLAPS
jgi:hypothetical protein